MARRVFFSFDYDRDIFRVSQVRNSGMTRGGTEEAGFIDAASWESVKRQGRAAIERWINTQMNGASVTVVLIGAATSSSEWVDYEIKRSVGEGKGLLGVYIHNLIDPRTRMKDSMGKSPFENMYFENTNPRRYLSAIYPVYDWVNNDGYNNLGTWVEQAARQAGR